MICIAIIHLWFLDVYLYVVYDSHFILQNFYDCPLTFVLLEYILDLPKFVYQWLSSY